MQNIAIAYVEQGQEVAPIPNYWNWLPTLCFIVKYRILVIYNMWPAIHVKQEFLIEILKVSKSDSFILFNLWITWKGIMETCNLLLLKKCCNIIGTLDFKTSNSSSILASLVKNQMQVVLKLVVYSMRSTFKNTTVSIYSLSIAMILKPRLFNES